MHARLRTMRVAAILTVLLFVPAYLLTLSPGQGIVRDGTSLVVGRDFLNIWMYGRAAWSPDPARYYEMDTYLAALGPIVGEGYPGQLWSYPPVALLVAAPFGLLSYYLALGLWTLLGAVSLAVSLRLWNRSKTVFSLMLASPAALLGVMSGQFALFGAAILLAILRWRESRPLRAGALTGLLLIKPQLALLLPLLFLVTRNWRAFAAAAASTGAIAGLVTLLWGTDIWLIYLQAGMANQSLVLSDPEHLAGPFMPTLFMNLRVAGVPVTTAYAWQGVIALVAAGLTVLAFGRRPKATDLGANVLFLCCAASVTPYLLSYDTLALTIMATLWLAAGGPRLPAILAFLLPLIQIAAGMIGWPGPAIIPIMLAAWLFSQEYFHGPLKFSRRGPSLDVGDV